MTKPKVKTKREGKTLARKKAKVAPVPRGFRSVTPHVIARNVQEAVTIYEAAFDAKLVSSQTIPNTDVIIFALVKIGNTRLSIGQGQTYGAGSVSLHLYVEDAKSTWANAVEAGFEVINPIKERYWGDLTGLLSDPMGVQWSLGQRVEKVGAKEQRKRAKKAIEKARKLAKKPKAEADPKEESPTAKNS